MSLFDKCVPNKQNYIRANNANRTKKGFFVPDTLKSNGQ